LIINADDFGLTRGINRAIAEAHQRGVVTSTTLMATGAEFDDAVALSRSLPQLSVGCHVDLIQLSPVLSPGQIPTLAGGQRFQSGFVRFASAALRHRLSTEEITAEATAQMRRLQSAGIALGHFDSHKHTHMFPHVLRPLLRAAKTCGIRGVRNPFEPRTIVTLPEVLPTPKLLARYCAVRALESLASRFRVIVEREGMATTDGTVGIVLTGFLTECRLQALIRRLPEGTWEMVVHPGYDDAALRPLSSLTASRERELALLTSSATRTLLLDAGIELISYRNLSPAQP
jgi:hopanoid biosynthesis associated protein HpnK